MRYWKAGCLVLLAAFLWWFNHRYLHLTPQMVQQRILSFGVWAPLLYIAVYTIRPLLFFPATILCLGGGLAFGPWWGTLYTLIGFTGDALLAFGLARRYGRGFFRSSERGRLQQWKERFEEGGLLSVLTLRLIPLVPFDVLSCAAGLSRIPIGPYLIGTVLGTLPVTVAYSFLGDSLTRGWNGALILSTTAVLLLALAPLWVIRRRSRVERT